jgi:hypothetical protein
LSTVSNSLCATYRSGRLPVKRRLVAHVTLAPPSAEILMDLGRRSIDPNSEGRSGIPVAAA